MNLYKKFMKLEEVEQWSLCVWVCNLSYVTRHSGDDGRDDFCIPPHT